MWARGGSRRVLPCPSSPTSQVVMRRSGAITAARAGWGRGKFSVFLSLGRRIATYFNDQVTGRLAARSGLVCANFFWFVYRSPVTWLSVEVQPNSLSSAAINSRRLSRRWRLRTATIMSSRVRLPFRLAGARPVCVLPRPTRVPRPSCFCAPVVFGLTAALCIVATGAVAISRVIPPPLAVPV
jgi:hypothetical protein